jgi:hypothetical protein
VIGAYSPVLRCHGNPRNLKLCSGGQVQNAVWSREHAFEGGLCRRKALRGPVLDQVRLPLISSRGRVQIGSVREPAFAARRQDRRTGLEALVLNEVFGRGSRPPCTDEPFARWEVLSPGLSSSVLSSAF